MGLFERYLSVWIGLCIIAGVLLGNLLPSAFQSIAGLEYAQVNLVIAVLIWIMIYPMMVQIDFSAIKDVGLKPRGLALTLVVNWLIKPFTMAALGWLFFKVIFVDWVDPQSATEYIAGMILLGVAPCTAMVFVWSQLTKGDPNYTLVQVSVNDIVMVFAFAPLAAFLLGVSDITVPWETLLLSVVLYVVLPLAAGAFTRHRLTAYADNRRVEDFVKALKPWSIIGLLHDRLDCDSTAHPNLWHFRHSLWGCESHEATPQHRGTRQPNWYLQLFRVGCSRGDISVWFEFGRGAGHRGRGTGGSSRHALTRCYYQSHGLLVSRGALIATAE
jgi:arsenical-resistance protein